MRTRLLTPFAAAMLTALTWTPSAALHEVGNPAPRPHAVGIGQKVPKANSQRWAPPNVDAPLSSVSSSPPCLVEKVMQEAGERAKELVTNLQNFTARERIQYEELDDFGNPRAAQNGTYDYLVFLNETRPGSLSVSETRNGSSALDVFPAAVADSGLPVMALIFHPYYADEYNMRCEGLGQWNGQATWVIHFEQRHDKPSHTHSFRTKDGHFPAKLKGRAWITADTYEILHLETNLVAAIPIIHLRSEAISINYAPVEFRTREVKLWLPESAEVFSDFENQRYHVRHTFSNFLLFSVATTQTIEKPRQP